MTFDKVIALVILIFTLLLLALYPDQPTKPTDEPRPDRRNRISQFSEPAELHDYQFLGDTYRERQDIRRLKKRWIDRLTAMPPQKRYAVLAAIDEFTRADNGTAAATGANDGENAFTPNTK